MFRYVAFVWDGADRAACDRVRVLVAKLSACPLEWQPVLTCPGLEVLCADARPGGSEPHLLHAGSGVVLGTLFASGGDGCSARAPLALAEHESADILASAGRTLVERYWGRYVAFLRDARSGGAWVLRDPSGGLPCQALRVRGADVDVYFSHMDEGALLGDRALSINWRYVAAAACQSRLQTHATGLNEVSQVLGGECIELRGGRIKRSFYWHPLRVAASEVIDDAGDAVRRLRHATRDCVHAWASSHRSIVHLLSGGLDSSIILACLKDAPTQPRITCLNFHSPGSNTDERTLARLAAQGVDCGFVERRRDSSVALKTLLGIQKSCIPADYFFYLEGGRSEAELAAERQATAVFSGYGGDQLFYQARARFAAGDYLGRHGFGRELFGVALNAARVDRVSVWNVLRAAVSHGLLGRRWSPRADAGRHRMLIRDDVLHDINRDPGFLHPLFRAPGRAPSGKIWHAWQLSFPMDFYNPLGSPADPETVAPLLSQPLVEVALRIPTWLLTLGGWDRSMARRAFQGDVPRQIVTRRAKGGQEEHAKAILTRNIDFARELLLDGQLVRERILDRARLAAALSGRPTRRGGGNVEIYGYLSLEAWLRQWLPA